MLNERIYEVIDFTEKEEVVDFEIEGTDLHVYYIDEDGIPSHYIGNMSERRNDLKYLLGGSN